MITVIYFGRKKEPYWNDAAAEYVKRIGGYSKINLIELEARREPEKEALLLHKAVPKNALVTALCVEGETLSSESFAERLKYGNICYIVGGAGGLADSVKKTADFRLSLSVMTLPHELAKIVLLEQIYRGFTIINNGRYHKV